MNIFKNLFNKKPNTYTTTDVYISEKERDVNTLIKLLNSEDSSVVLACISSLGNIEAKEATEPLLELLNKSENKEFQLHIVVALSNIGDPKAADVLIKFLDDEDVDFQSWSAKGFIKIKDNRSIPKLIEGLIRAPEIKYDFEHALANQGDDALSQLEKLVEHTDEKIIFYALQTIQLIGTEKAADLLLNKILPKIRTTG